MYGLIPCFENKLDCTAFSVSLAPVCSASESMHSDQIISILLVSQGPRHLLFAAYLFRFAFSHAAAPFGWGSGSLFGEGVGDDRGWGKWTIRTLSWVGKGVLFGQDSLSCISGIRGSL